MIPKCNTCVYKTAMSMCRMMYQKDLTVQKVFSEFCKGKWYFTKDECKVEKTSDEDKRKKKPVYESLDVIDP